jgi:hypothetical protein
LFHPIKRGRFPNKLYDKSAVRFLGCPFGIFDLKTYLLSLGNFGYMAPTFPFDLAIDLISEFELIPGHKSHIVFIWENKVSHLLLIDVVVPSDLDIILSLGFFELFIVISFKTNERLKYLFVLFRVLVAEEHWLLQLLCHNVVQVIECGVDVRLPKLL